MELLVTAGGVLLWMFGFLLWMCLMCVLLVLMGLAFEGTRRKGYGQLVPGLIDVAGAIVGLGVGFMAPSLPTAAFGGAAACAAFLVAIPACLPRRQRRIFGQRRAKFPYEVVGWLIIFGGGVPLTAFFVYDLWPDIAPAAGFSGIGFLLFCVLGYPFVLRGRFLASRKTLETELAEDPRPPVLYIRPFESERDVFVIGAKAKYGRYQRRAMNPNKIQTVFISFEEYLSETIRSHVGPFVALGSPEDSLAPAGAARTYAKDDTWQGEFDRLVRSAGAILVEIRRSQNLRWEFEHIRKGEWHRRLFLVTGHASVPRRLVSTPPRWRWLQWLNTRLERLYGVSLSSSSWSTLSAELGEFGYRIDIDDPGPGAVVTFDGEGVAKVIATGADLPDDFVKPIAAQIGAATVGA